MLKKLGFLFHRRPVAKQGEWTMKTRDASTAIQFRMNAGFSGAVNRSHPASVIPHQNDPTNPVQFFGQAVAVNAAKNGVRQLLNTDTAVFGIATRTFPFQQGQAATDFAPATIGTAAPLAGMAIDVLKSGWVMVQLPAGQSPGLGDPVYVWKAANSGAHIQGNIEAVDPAGNGFAITGAYFNGGPDASGNVEIAFNV